MKVNVTATRCIVENDVELNAGEYNINKFYFTFSPEYLDNYVKKALFVAKDKPPIEMVIANDECDIPNDILKKPGVYMVGVYAYEIDENNELILRYSPEPTHFYVNRGSYIENAETPTEPDPDEFAQYYQAMQDLIATAKPEFKEYIDENLPTVEVGEVETLPPGSQVIITNSGTDRHPILNFGIPEGKKGDTIDQIEIESDDKNYQFKIKIYDNDGKLISESNMVDLPIEIFAKNTDYATENVGGVIKSSSNSGFVVDGNTGKVSGVNTSYSDLVNKDNKYLISKGTLDKYVTGKRLVSRTDYADSTTAGVIKVGTNADVDSNGYLKGNVLTYNQYLERNAENFISKGTLENLLRTRDYLKNSDAESTYSTIAETGKTIELDINNSTYAMTISLKDKNGNTLSSDTIDLPLETMVVDAYYDKYSKEIVLTLQSGTSTRFSVADLVSGLQSEITANNKLKSDLVDDTNQVHKFVTSEEKTTWNNKSDFSGSYNDLTDVPTIPTQLDELSDDSTHRLVTDNEKSTWNGKQDKINDLETIRSGAASGKTAVQFNDLATVATSGSYNDLSNKPTIPTKLSQLSDDSAHRLVSDTEKTTWNNKSDFSGSYNDLSNKPTIPTSTSQLTNNSNFVSDSAYVHTDNNYTDNEKNKLADLENYDDTEVKESITDLNNSIITIGKIKADKTSIPKNTSDLNNDSGYITKNVNDLTYYTLATDTGSFIDLEINTTTYVVTLSLKNSEGTVISSDSIDLPLENVVVSGSYNNSSQKIILTLQNGTTVDIPVGDLVAGLQTEITSSNKIASDLIDDSNSGNKFVTNSEKSTWNGKQNAITSSNKLSTSLISGLATVATSGSYNDLTDVPTIPTQVTESTVSGWGFTKNTGTYIKPSTGIPKTDLASGVQTSLEKADTALQSISSSDVTTALGYTPYNSTNPNGYTSNTGTITGVKMNGSTIASGGVADLGTVITEHQDISGKQDKIVAGTNISIASDGKTISATDTTYSNATTTTAGLMSSDDKTKLNGIETGATKNLNYYGTCATAATKQAKVVVCDGFILENGATISVLFTYGQSYNGVLTLNVNSTGAKNIRYKADTNAVQYIWSAGEIIDFTYNGTYWIMHRSALATTLYYGLAKYSDSLTSTSSALGATPKAINTAMTNIISGTPIYSTSSTYNVGDRVRYSNNVWECITAITTAEAWTAAHWQEVAPLQEQIDDKQDAITSSNKLSSDLVSDVNSTNKFITSAERTTWNSKQSLLVSGTNIKTINNESILGSGNITIEGGGTVNTYYLVNILNMTSTSDATYEIVNDLINNNQFVIFDDPDGMSRELFCYVPIKTYYQSALDIQTFWYIDNQDKYNLVVITHSGTSVIVTRTTYHSIEEAYNLADGKQNALVSGTNIKTINNQSLLGSGNITIEGGGSGTVDTAMSDSSTNAVQNRVIKSYVDDTIEANYIDVRINDSPIVSDNIANISVTGSYNETGSPLLSLWDVMIDDSIPLGPDENSIRINTTSGNYDGTSVLLATNDTLKSEYVPIAADAAMQGTNYSSSINNVGYQIEFGLTNNTSGDSNSIVLTPTETYIGNVKDPENDGDAVNKKYVDDAVSDKSDFSGSYNDLSDKPTIPTKLSQLDSDVTHRVVTDSEKTTWNSKQSLLVSGTNIKTINNQSILGSGNITIEGGGSGTVDTAMSDSSTNAVQNKVIKSYVDDIVGDIGTILDNINGEVIGG